MNRPTIADYMTRAPHTIGHDQTLAAAHALMREHKIRHLPVLIGGRLVGILSQRDLDFVETLDDVDPAVIEVSEAMSQDVYVTAPLAPLRKVVAEMAAQKYGSAIVVDGDHVIGVFTTIDALRALADLLPCA